MLRLYPIPELRLPDLRTDKTRAYGLTTTVDSRQFTDHKISYIMKLHMSSLHGCEINPRSAPYLLTNVKNKSKNGWTFKCCRICADKKAVAVNTGENVKSATSPYTGKCGSCP
ncbi:terpene synthase 21 [Striga asiatica]|uniref:Terpene synthase 21 n=1 Tax=Striga asiatica TaxID=4170 RepID=A0A5A7QKM1_STRAF|nr:terpene synthase 21 [Striga asiatica]